MRDILDVHTHTVASGHAFNTMYEMAKSAADKGLALLGLTDHAPSMPGSAHEFYFSNLRAVPRELFGIPVMHGAELNILNDKGEVDLPERILTKLDVCIASVHPPCYAGGEDTKYNTRAYLNAMANPYVNIIGHPDDGRIPVDFEALVRGAKEHHVLLEVNNASLTPGGVRKNTRGNDLEMLKLCRTYGVPVIFSSDAHIESAIGVHNYCWEVAKEAEFPEELIVNGSVEMLMDYINYGKRNR